MRKNEKLIAAYTGRYKRIPRRVCFLYGVSPLTLIIHKSLCLHRW